MFITSPMNYLKLVVLEKDIQYALDLLADYGWLEIKQNPQAEATNPVVQEKAALLAEIEDYIAKINQFLQLPSITEKGSLTSINDLNDFFEHLSQEISGKNEL
ncbi:MAG: hypothetical protein MJB14_20160, partial [Spirochaetes bacterium]|nr:hypothetical protein [Spirochaetota bacterium]